MTEGAVLHLLLGQNEHHVLPMIRSFHRNAREMGIAGARQRYVVCGAEPEKEALYRDLGPAPEDVLLYPDLDLTPDILAQAEAGGRLIIHSSFFPGLWSVLRGRPELWPRTAIVFWGNDLIPVWRRPWVNGGLRPYLRLGIVRVAARIRAEPPQKDREAVLPHLGAVCTLTPGEGEALDSRYGPLENRRIIVYQTHPADLDLLPRSDPAEDICVIVGNSAHESGRQAQILARLSRFRGEPMTVICPLGYPASSAYKDDVLRRGERLLGEQFESLADMLSRDDYHRVLDAADVFVVNAHRQQGLYGIIYSLLRGTKVYLWEKSPTFRMLTDMGIRVFSVRELASCSFSEFRALSDEDRRRNHEIALRRLSLPAAVRCWRELLRDLETPPEKL